MKIPVIVINGINNVIELHSKWQRKYSDYLYTLEPGNKYSKYIEILSQWTSWQTDRYTDSQRNKQTSKPFVYLHNFPISMYVYIYFSFISYVVLTDCLSVFTSVHFFYCLQNCHTL